MFITRRKPTAPVAVGQLVRIKPGVCGGGFRFTVTAILQGERGPQVYGRPATGGEYGPVRLEDVEPV